MGEPSGKIGGRSARGISKKIALVALDTLLITIAYTSAFWLRLEPEQLAEHASTIARTLPVVLGVTLIVHLKHGLFNAILRYASLETALAVARSVGISVVTSALVLHLLFRLDDVPRSIFVIHAMASLLLVGGSRLTLRCWSTGGRSSHPKSRILLYGAGDIAALAIRGLKLSRELEYQPVGIIDPDASRRGQRLLGVPILGDESRLREAIEQHDPLELWICRPGMPGEELRKLYELTEHHPLKIKILPRLRDTLLGEDLHRFQEPRIADLLRRPPRSLDREKMRGWLAGRRVLITGAGGSIGSELALQIARLRPGALALCDSSETNLFQVARRLSGADHDFVTAPYMVDVRDANSLERMFEEVRPDVVFHAAAYKHVPLVEQNPCQGVTTNVLGVYRVARAAAKSGVEQMVFISTDKAVRPSSVMGATKRAGEIVIQEMNRHFKTRFMAVRFGNVLGSSGSVVPIFQEQIRQGGPVTVTHPEMTRYFMLISEAVELVIQAGTIGQGGEIFILDMGKPVKIADMARDLIRLMGKRVDEDIEIRYTGIRPGEKIHEELLIDTGDFRTDFQEIWIEGIAPGELGLEILTGKLERLDAAARAGDRARCLDCLADLVPGFQPGSAEVEPPPRLPAARRKATTLSLSERSGVTVPRQVPTPGPGEPSLQ